MEVMSTNVEHPELASRPFDVDRDGFVLGEGAGFVVLQRYDDAVAEGRSVLGVVAGYGSCADAHHLVAPDEQGVGARRGMRAGLRAMPGSVPPRSPTSTPTAPRPGSTT